MSQYVRSAKYSVQEIFDKIDEAIKTGKPAILNGDAIHLTSSRYINFRRNGIKCSKCGISGKFFAKEIDASQYRNGCRKWHLNLYAVTRSNNEILMTKDHIAPKALGGSDKIDNYQTMCVVCNQKKGARFEKE